MQSFSTAASNATKRLLFIRHRQGPCSLTPPKPRLQKPISPTGLPCSPPHHPPSTSEINEHIAKHPWGLPGFIDPGLRDAKLSVDGVALARSRAPTFLKEHAQFLADTRLIVSSPLTRTLHTAQLLLSGTQAEVPLMMLPLASERVYLT
jgi:hypothetical protein